jgi:erythrin-vacuolar iron transport family protein
MKNFSDLALAITLEEEDSRIYDEFANGLHENYSDTAKDIQRYGR